MKAAALLLALVAGASCAPAQAHTIGVHLVTAHFGGHGLKSENPGVYGRIDDGAMAGLTVGVYRNSYDRTSSYVAWTWQTEDQRFAVTAGAVTGYSASAVMPLLVPSVRMPIAGGFALRTSFIPKPVKNGHAAGLHLSVERSF